jgi:hypothetical protein
MIEKKQKKVFQKEKRSRPFSKDNMDQIVEHPRKQVLSADDEGDGLPSGKRRRIAQSR